MKIDEIIKEIELIDQNKFFEFKRQDKPVIAWSSIYTPVELLYAGGVNSYRLTGRGILDQSDAVAWINSNYCSHILCMLSEGLKGEFGRFDGIVDVDECDQRSRMIDKFRKVLNPSFNYFIELPRCRGELSLEYFHVQIQGLKNVLEKTYGSISDNVLSEAIILHNCTRKLLKQIMGMYEKRNESIPYVRINNLIQATMSSLKTDINSGLKKIVSCLEVNQKVRQVSEHVPRVMIIGSYFEHDKIIQHIESLGASIICADNSNGIRTYDRIIDETGDPLYAITKYYYSLSLQCGIYDIDDRMKRVLNIIESQKIDYVIFIVLKFCDTNLMDYPHIKNTLKKHGIPVLMIEYEQSILNIESIKTRLETFLY